MKRIFFLTIIILFVSFFAFSQDYASHDVTLNIGDICVLDLNNTATITLNLTAPAQGGLAPVGDTDNSKLLQYTSVVPTGQYREITVNWEAIDSAPAGTSLLLEVTNVPVGCGSAGSQVTLSDTAQPIITNIGNCATGIGANGSALLYTFNIDDMAQLEVGDSTTVTITFTLTDAS